MKGVGDEAAKSRQEERCGQLKGDLNAPGLRRPAPDDGQEAAQAPGPVGGVHRGLLSCTGRGLGHSLTSQSAQPAGQRLRISGPRPIQGALGERGLSIWAVKAIGTESNVCGWKGLGCSGGKVKPPARLPQNREACAGGCGLQGEAHCRTADQQDNDSK